MGSDGLGGDEEDCSCDGVALGGGDGDASYLVVEAFLEQGDFAEGVYGLGSESCGKVLF